MCLNPEIPNEVKYREVLAGNISQGRSEFLEQVNLSLLYLLKKIPPLWLERRVKGYLGI